MREGCRAEEPRAASARDFSGRVQHAHAMGVVVLLNVHALNLLYTPTQVLPFESFQQNSCLLPLTAPPHNH